MKLSVKVKPGAKKNVIAMVSPTQFEVTVKAAPEGGKANAAVEKVVADYFDIAPSRVRVIKGHTSKYKVVEIK